MTSIYFNIEAICFGLAVVSIALGFWTWCLGNQSAARYERFCMFEELTRFHLVRRVTVRPYIPNVQSVKIVTSTHTVEIGTDDPFRTREVLNGTFGAGWYVVTFETATDREYGEKFEGPRP